MFRHNMALEILFPFTPVRAMRAMKPGFPAALEPKMSGQRSLMQVKSIAVGTCVRLLHSEISGFEVFTELR